MRETRLQLASTTKAEQAISPLKGSTSETVSCRRTDMPTRRPSAPLPGHGKVASTPRGFDQLHCALTLALHKARELGLNELITLSTQTFTYFQSKGGFTEGTPDDLPPSRRDKYDQSGRNSEHGVEAVDGAKRYYVGSRGEVFRAAGEYIDGRQC